MSKPKPINLTAHESRGMLAGRVTMLWRVVKPQPEKIEWFEHQRGWLGSFGADAGSYKNPHRMIPSPFGSPGTRLIGKIEVYGGIARHHLETGSVSVKRCQEVTEAEALAMGYTPLKIAELWKVTFADGRTFETFNEPEITRKSEWMTYMGAKVAHVIHIPAREHSSALGDFRKSMKPDAWARNVWLWVATVKPI